MGVGGFGDVPREALFVLEYPLCPDHSRVPSVPVPWSPIHFTVGGYDLGGYGLGPL